jgi:hypothetical protein
VVRERVSGRELGAQRSSEGAVQRSVDPGKRTLTECLVTGGRATEAPNLAGPGTAAAAAAHAGESRSSAVPLQLLFGARSGATATPAADPAQMQAVAARGAATPAAKLPYADQIQNAFGRHDISGIQAHQGSDATASAREMGAQAYAMGDHVVLGDGADLHTVAPMPSWASSGRRSIRHCS